MGKGVEILDADQGNKEVAPAFEASGILVAGAEKEFGDESIYYIVRPYVLN